MQKIIDMLHQQGCSCVIRNGESVRCFTKRGVADLYELLQKEPQMLKSADIADKVIGKGAAALLILGGISRVYADVMSQPAFELLHNAGVRVTFGLKVPHIINRSKTGLCPIEELCEPIRTAQECLPLIERFMQMVLKK
ncbi:MAG: DUF1893 domain-containing protein [Paludibacteraceae bacterium]|nr:DUF1893 domain-containing protein [Paludibacteraceae bacterium]